jgi:hypothetical protein
VPVIKGPPRRDRDLRGPDGRGPRPPAQVRVGLGRDARVRGPAVGSAQGAGEDPRGAGAHLGQDAAALGDAEQPMTVGVRDPQAPFVVQRDAVRRHRQLPVHGRHVAARRWWAEGRPVAAVPQHAVREDVELRHLIPEGLRFQQRSTTRQDGASVGEGEAVGGYADAAVGVPEGQGGRVQLRAPHEVEAEVADVCTAVCVAHRVTTGVLGVSTRRSCWPSFRGGRADEAMQRAKLVGPNRFPLAREGPPGAPTLASPRVRPCGEVRTAPRYGATGPTRTSSKRSGAR